MNYFEKSFEYKREKLLQEATEARHKVDLVEVDSKYQGSIVPSSVRKKVNPAKTNLDDKSFHLVQYKLRIQFTERQRLNQT